MRRGSLLAAVAALITFAIAAQVVSAQYPSPKATLICVVTQVDVKIDSSTDLTVTLRDSGGNPLSGHLVNFFVDSGDASLSSASGTTDGAGTAVVTVSFGSSSGPVVVRAVSDDIECRATANVKGIVPPTTGSAGIGGVSGNANGALYAGFATLLATLVAGGVCLRKARRL